MATVVRKSSTLVVLIASFIDSFKRMVADGGAGGAVSGTSASATPTFTGQAPSAAVREPRVTGTGYSTSGQVVTTTESFTASANAYAGCWLLTATKAPCLIMSHPAVSGAALALTVYGAAPATTSEGFLILATPTPEGTVSSHAHGAGSFASSPASSDVHYDRGEYTVTTASASGLATSLTLCQSLMQAYGTHIADALAHDAVDDTNELAYTRAEVFDLPTAILAANDLKSKYNAHRSQSGVHPNNDSGHAVSSSNATDQGSLNTLLNELKSDFNAHIADGMATPSWRATQF